MLHYAPYPSRAGALGVVGALERVTTTAGWKTPSRELVAEFTQDQRRTPSAAEIVILRRLAERNNAILKRMVGGHSPSRDDERDFNTAQGLINFYLTRGRGPDGKDPVAPPRGGPETEAIVTTAVHAVPGKQSFFDAITHAPISLLVNPADGILHKLVGDKTYYAVAKAVGGDKVEAALRAGNHPLADLTKGSTQADLVKQGVQVALVAAQEKLTPAQVQAVLASLPPATAQAARDALAGKPPAGAPAAPAPAPAPAKAPLRALDPPKRPAPAAAAPAPPAKPPLRALDPPKRPAAAPAGASTAPMASPGAPAAAATSGAFVYAPYPQSGAVSAPPPHGGHHGGGGSHGGHGHGHGGGGGHARPVVRGGGGGGGRGWWGVPWNYEVITTTETCRTWGDPIERMPVEMLTAAREMLGASGGRPTTVRGPDGVLYLLALEGKAVTARPCAAVATS